MWNITNDTAEESRVHSLLSVASPSVREENFSRHESRQSNASNLQRSILLLDDNLRQTPSLFKRSGKSMDHSKSFNLSQSHDTSRLNAGVSQMNKSHNQSTDSTRFDRSAQGNALLQESIKQVVNPDLNMTMTSAALLSEEDPGIEATSGLFTDFLDVLKSYASEYQIFEIITKYEELCSEQLTLLSKLLRLAPPGDNKFSKTRAIKMFIRQEMNTWRLLRTLYKDRLFTDPSIDPDSVLMDTIGKKLSEKDVVSNFYQTDSTTRQCQLVIDWLEQNASDELDYQNQMEFFSDNSVTWENTLHYLNQERSRTYMSSGQRPIVDQMDPDAPVRQNCPLHDLDKEDDGRMYKFIFSNIRGGDLSRAQELTAKCGQPWLAAALEGWRLAHDNNYSSFDSSQVVTPTEGNSNRDIWKSVCWKLASEDRLTLYERATYGIFSGNLKLLLQVCSSWEDYLWAYLRVMVDTRVEQELRESTHNIRVLEPLPDSYSSKVLNVENIFEEIQASSSVQVKSESTDFYHIIQKYIIIGDLDGLIEEMYEQVRNDVRPSQHTIRFMAHLTLFLRSVGDHNKEELCVPVLEAYVQDLIEEKRIALVASYVSTLPKSQQICWYSKFLEGVIDKEERQLCLQLAEEANIDVALVTKMVVENIRHKKSVEPAKDTLHAKTTEDDKLKIEAVDWLIFNEAQRIEAVKQANALMRIFVACKKVDAAKEVFNKIPSNSIDVIIRQHHLQTGTTDLLPEDDNAVREYICIQAYLQSLDAFNDWFKHLNYSKPKKPHLTKGASFSEKVAFEHLERQHESDMERWHQALSLQAQMTKERMYNVLLFIDGGWMVDQQTDATVDDSRVQQMKLLREICLPRICTLLHTVLHSTGCYKESVQLANLVASEQHRIYAAFGKNEMIQFLSNIKESSLALLDENMDPFGYPLD